MYSASSLLEDELLKNNDYVLFISISPSEAQNGMLVWKILNESMNISIYELS